MSQGTHQSLPKRWRLMLSAAFSFNMPGAEATIKSSLWLLTFSPSRLSSPSLCWFCAFSFQSLWLYWAFSSPSSGSYLAYLLPSLCLLPPWHPLAPSSLTLSSTYLWITNDNGLCSLMWEFCNQPRCMAYALMALIFSDLNAPQDHQQQGESTQTNSAQNKRVVNLVSNSECDCVNCDVLEPVPKRDFTKISQAYSG